MTQKERVLNYMERFETISTMQAFNDLGITRLSQMIFLLRNDGYVINSNKMKGTNRFGDTVHYENFFIESTPSRIKGVN